MKFDQKLAFPHLHHPFPRLFDDQNLILYHFFGKILLEFHLYMWGQHWWEWFMEMRGFRCVWWPCYCELIPTKTHALRYNAKINFPEKMRKGVTYWVFIHSNQSIIMDRVTMMCWHLFKPCKLCKNEDNVGPHSREFSSTVETIK